MFTKMLYRSLNCESPGLAEECTHAHGLSRWRHEAQACEMLTRLQGAGASGQEAARFCTWVGGFLPMPANSERSLSPPSMYRNCTAEKG